MMMPDLAVELLVPPLMEKITTLAPNLRLDIVPWRGPAIMTGEFARTLDLGISIGNAFKGFHRQFLYEDADALAVRRGHPVGAKLKRRETFLNARHVAVIIRGQNADLIDDWLRAKGLERQIALVVPATSRRSMSWPAPTSLHSCRAASSLRWRSRFLSPRSSRRWIPASASNSCSIQPVPPDGSGLDLTPQHDDRGRARTGPAQAAAGLRLVAKLLSVAPCRVAVP
jgi:DNA-binding transcriptional LysR family regulator